MTLLAALAHTYAARKTVVNPIKTLRFFSNGLNGIARDDLGKFHLTDKIQFYARFRDWAAVQEIVFEQEYGFIRAVLNDNAPPTIVDLGANIGMFSLYALSIWPKAMVYALEPSQYTYQVLERNRLANSHLNWNVFRYAIWQVDGEVRFENREFSTSSRIGDQISGDEMVPALSLFTLFSKLVSTPTNLLKIDIEGAEEAALCGNEAILRSVEHLIIEVHPQLCNHDRVIASLHAAYDFLYRIPGRRSSKPLLLASRQPQPYPVYQPI